MTAITQCLVKVCVVETTLGQHGRGPSVIVLQTILLEKQNCPLLSMETNICLSVNRTPPWSEYNKRLLIVRCGTVYKLFGNSKLSWGRANPVHEVGCVASVVRTAGVRLEVRLHVRLDKVPF